MEHRQSQIGRMEDRAESDGVVTANKRARLGAVQLRTARGIAREKHGPQEARLRDVLLRIAS